MGGRLNLHRAKGAGDNLKGHKNTPLEYIKYGWDTILKNLPNEKYNFKMSQITLNHLE